jgi:outer membrane protein assembly factor BamB
VLINIFTYPGPAGPTYYAQDVTAGLLGGLNNTSVTIKKPDGTSSTFMPIDVTLQQVGISIPGQAQIVGSLMFYYTPDQLGNYSVTASFGGKTYTTDQVYKSLNLSVYYKPSATKVPATFTVQQDKVLNGQLNGYPWSPLPNDYWQDPVQTDNREWAAISGDWIQGNLLVMQYISSYNEYSTAPKSSHIVWANQVSLGGLPGGDWGSLPYNGGGGAANIILDGKIYQPSKQSGYFDCVDLRTGQILWTAAGNPTVALRLKPFYQTAAQVNEGGITASLWEVPGTAGTWKRYDPFSGALLQTITNVPTNLNTIAFSDGNPIVICNQSPQGDRPSGSDPGFNKTRPMGVSYSYLIRWNQTKVTGNNWLTGVEWNVSTIDPALNIYKGEVNVGDNGFYGIRAFPFPEANVIVLRTHNAMQIMEGWDYTTGKFLWRNTNTVLDIGVNDAGNGNGPIILLDGANQQFVAYNVKTGREQWRASMGDLPWGIIPDYCYCLHNGNFYTGSYDGHVYAWNLETGKQVWKSDYYGPEDESIYGTQPFNGRAVGADGILYFSTATVYSLMPRTRFHALVAINETTGKFLWKLPIGSAPRSIADGYLVATDSENGMQYCIGKGKTATTITAPLNTVAAGTAVLIQGTINDMSLGKPNTPAVSEADMAEWMDYLYGQNATLLNSPPKPNGVSVRLSAVGPNGDVIEIGTVTSGSGGMFKKMWTPQTEGEYTVYATFDGSNSYWGSYAETGLGITEAPADTSTNQPALEATDYTMTIVGVGIAVIIAVAIAAVAIILMVRKR